MSEQKIMVRTMYDALLNDKGDPNEAFQTLITYVASKFTMNDAVDTYWMNPVTLLLFDSIFSIETLQKNPRDWFGELHQELGLSVIDNSLLIQHEDLEKIAPDTVKSKQLLPLRILDTEAYTGRHIIEMWKKNPNAIYYGVESDLNAYRIALINMNCYGIRHSILYGNPDEMDLREFSPNWRETNVWQPTNRRIQREETDERLRLVDGLYRVV